MHRAILVASSCPRMHVGKRRTGVSLQQLGSVHRDFVAAGWQVEVASPQGGEVPLDAGTLSEQWMPAAGLASTTLRLDTVRPEDADAWFVLGGHGVLLDLVGHESLQRLLSQALYSGTPVGAIDHGVAALSHLTGEDGRPLLAGRSVTGRTDLEELQIRHENLVPHTTEQLLRATGAKFLSTDPWRPHVVVDGTVVTAQNPASAMPAVEAVRRLVDPVPLAA